MNPTVFRLLSDADLLVVATALAAVNDEAGIRLYFAACDEIAARPALNTLPEGVAA